MPVAEATQKDCVASPHHTSKPRWALEGGGLGVFQGELEAVSAQAGQGGALGAAGGGVKTRRPPGWVWGRSGGIQRAGVHGRRGAG